MPALPPSPPRKSLPHARHPIMEHHPTHVRCGICDCDNDLLNDQDSPPLQPGELVECGHCYAITRVILVGATLAASARRDSALPDDDDLIICGWVDREAVAQRDARRSAKRTHRAPPQRPPDGRIPS